MPPPSWPLAEDSPQDGVSSQGRGCDQLQGKMAPGKENNSPEQGKTWGRGPSPMGHEQHSLQKQAFSTRLSQHSHGVEIAIQSQGLPCLVSGQRPAPRGCFPGPEHSTALTAVSGAEPCHFLRRAIEDRSPGPARCQLADKRR